MRILLIRHAVTAETGSKLTGRLPGVPLSSRGIDMAEQLAVHLSTLPLGAVYTSPIERCAQTAAIIAAPHDVEPIEIPDLVETDFGSWSGRTLKSLTRLAAWRELTASAARFRFPEGETLFEVQVRTVAALERLSADHEDETVAVVTHADVIRVALSHYLGAPLELVHRLHVSPATVSEIDLAESGTVVVPRVNWSAVP